MSILSSKKAPLTIDHIVPKNKGGEDSWTNLVIACQNCNRKKGNKTLKQSNMDLIKNLENPIKFNIFKNLSRANRTPGSLIYLWSLCEKKNFERHTAIWRASFGKLFWNDVKND